MKILIDCDGVLSNFGKKCFDKINGKYGTSVTEEHITVWDWLKEGVPGVPRAAIKELVNDWIHEKDFVASMEVLPGAAEGLEKLRKVGHVVCVTSPWHATHWVIERTRWLQKHLGFSSKDIVHTSGKSHVFGHMLIDDKPENIFEWLDAQEHLPRWDHNRAIIPGILWGAPYNAMHEAGRRDGRRWARVLSWSDAVREAEVIRETLPLR